MQSKTPVLVSACLAGERCRYDGRACPDKDLVALVARGVAVSACPEVLGGLGTPRPAAAIVGGDGRDVISGSATVITMNGNDVTGEFIIGAHMMVALAEATGCTRAVLKSKSPSCGVDTIFDGRSGKMKRGAGVAAAALADAGIEIESRN